jgi:tetratricopeptide (TPR) repeat protein
MPARRFKFDVFLSYNRAQKDWTRELARCLRNDGFNVWFDEWVLPQHAGRNWITELREGIEDSSKIALVWSPEFFKQQWPTFEATIGQLMDPVGWEDRLIPLLHTSCKIPKDWAFRQALDFTSAPMGTIEFEFHYHHLVHNLDNSRPYEGDFEQFKKLKTGKIDPNTIPPVRPLPPGSRMPQAPNPLFVGREDEMRDLNRMLTPGSGALVGVHAAVIGMGGVGKTQLAVEYAHRYGHLYQGGVFWLNFAGEEDPINEVARCGGPEGMDIAGWAEMKAPEQASRVQKAWEEGERAALLIFDNAEQPAAVDKWRPKSGHCSVLITSRRADWPPEMGVNPLGIETLPREKSLELLAEVRPLIAKDGKDREAADKICHLLGDLPLALTVAAAYLRKYKSDSVSQYLKALSAQPAIQDSSLQKVSASFAVSYNKLKPQDPTDALAQKLFYLASWFAPVSINRDLLIDSAGFDSADRDARHRAEDALARLIELGLIKEEADHRLLLHRLLREFARLKAPAGLDQGEAIKAVGESLGGFAYRENESGLPQDLARERAHLREVANQAEPLDPDLAARLYNNLGFNGRVLALLREGRADHEQALRLAEAALGPEHPDVATYVNNLGLALKELGDLAGAHANYKRALKIDEAVYGPEHPKVAIRVNNLGDVLQDLGDMAGARANYERSLKIGETVYGPDHPKVALRLSNLGTVLYDLGDLAGARANFERALKIDEAVYGPDHPDVAIDVSNLGSVLKDLGDLAGARANHERALKIDEAVYGPEHPNVAIRLGNLGSVLRDLGDSAGARTNIERALKIGEAVYGPDHPQVAIYVNNLGRVLQQLGDLAGARANYERALKIDEAVYGPDHPNVAIDVSNLGSVLRDLGNLAGTRANYERALKIFEKALGADHPNTRIVQRNLDALAIEENQQKRVR